MGRLHKLTQGKVNAAKTPGLYSDGGNLHLRVAAGGSRQWVFRYTLSHRTRDYGVGPYPTLSSAEARDRAHKLRKLLLDKIDPIENRNEQRANADVATAKHMTFDAAAAAYISTHEQGWRSLRHRKEWRNNSLQAYASPVFGRLPVAPSTPVWLSGPWKEFGCRSRWSLRGCASASRRYWTGRECAVIVSGTGAAGQPP